MAQKRKPVPLDSPAVISVRERMKPGDVHIVLCRNAEGKIVQQDKFGNGLPYKLPSGMFENTDVKKLKHGVLEKWAHYWENKHQRAMAVAMTKGWVPVKRSDNEYFCPTALGAEVDDLWHNTDVILVKKPLADMLREVAEARVYRGMVMNGPDQTLKAVVDATPGVRDFETSVTPGDEGLTLTQPGSE